MKFTKAFLAIALFAGTVWSCCKMDTPDPCSTYFGSWSLFDITYVFSADELEMTNTSLGSHVKVSIIAWTEVDNSNPVTKDEYPLGYKITGTISESSNPFFLVGESWGGDWAYFINKDNMNELMEQFDDNIGIVKLTRIQ